MHILFDARMVHYRRAGGIAQYSISLLRAMSRLPQMGRGDRVSVLQMRADRAPIVSDPRFKRVPVLTPPHHRLEQPALGLELLRIGPRPRLIHSPDFIPPRYRRFPAVVNIQDLAFLKFPETALLTGESKRYYGQVGRAARDAAAIIALSESAREDIVCLLGADPSKVVVIPAAAGGGFTPPTDTAQAREEAARRFGLPSPAEGGYILFVGTIEPRKNIPVLLQAYRLLLDRGAVRPMPALVLAGREGWLYEQTYRRMDELGLRGHVKRIGEVPGDGLAALYRGARAFALPSLYEGFGLPALEAMSCGVPVLASSAGSLAEVVGGAGLLLDPQDPESWADALARVLLDEQESARLRAEGPRRAAHFSWEKAALQTWELYRQVAASR